jgi:hypothetical protein
MVPEHTAGGRRVENNVLRPKQCASPKTSTWPVRFMPKLPFIPFTL